MVLDMMKRCILALFAISIYSINVTSDLELQNVLIKALRTHDTAVPLSTYTQVDIVLMNDIVLSDDIATVANVFTPPMPALPGGVTFFRPAFPFLAPIGSFVSFAENNDPATASEATVRTVSNSLIAIDGSDRFRGFIIRGGSNNSISNVTFTNLVARGGRGSLGGSGAGLGGGISFVGATVGNGNVLTNTRFINCQAIGGIADPAVNAQGGASINIASSGVGGSGIGGSPQLDGGVARGGGGFITDAMGDMGGGDARANESGGSIDFTIASGDIIAENGDRTVTIRGMSVTVAGGGAGATSNMFNTLNVVGGGNGGFGSGGGARTSYNSGIAAGRNEGRGGFGGGGGYGNGTQGGLGGFGAGGGGSSTIGGLGGLGASDGTLSQGGDAAGFGGALFIYTTAQVTCSGDTFFENNRASGSVIPIADIGVSVLDNRTFSRRNSVYGHDIFLMTGGMLTFNIPEGSSVNIPNAIDGDLGAEFYNVHSPSVTFPNVANINLRVPANSDIALEKTGEGTLILNGDNTYTALTVVREGVLAINGSLRSDVIIQTGASVRGVFTILSSQVANPRDPANPLIVNGMVLTNSFGSIVIQDGATLEITDDAIRPLELQGSFFHQDGGTLRIHVNPANDPDRVIIRTANPNLGSAVMLEAVLVDGNYIAGRRFRLFPTSLSIDYSTVVNVGSNADIDISYSEGAIDINQTAIFRNFIPDSKLTQGLTRGIGTQGAAVANASLAFQRIIEEVGYSYPELERNLLQLAPWQYGSINWMHARDTKLAVAHIASRSYERFFVLSPLQLESWATATVNSIEQCRKGFVFPFSNVSSGGIYGVDYHSSNGLYGVCFGYRRSFIRWQNSALNSQSDNTKANMHSYFGGIYGASLVDIIFLDYSILGGTLIYSGDRLFHFFDDKNVFQATFPSSYMMAHICMSTFLDNGKRSTRIAQFRNNKNRSFFDVSLQPFITLDYSFFRKKAFSETPAEERSFFLQEKHHHLFITEFGINAFAENRLNKVNTLWQVGCSTVIEFVPYRQYETFILRPLPDAINIPTYNDTFWYFSLSLSVKLFLSKSASLSFYYRQLLQNDVYIHSGQIQLSFNI